MQWALTWKSIGKTWGFLSYWSVLVWGRADDFFHRSQNWSLGLAEQQLLTGGSGISRESSGSVLELFHPLLQRYFPLHWFPAVPDAKQLNINGLPGKLKHAAQKVWEQLGCYGFPGDCLGKHLSFPHLPSAVVGVASPAKLCAVTTMPSRGVKPKRQHEELAACLGKRFLIQSVITGLARQIGCLSGNLCCLRTWAQTVLLPLLRYQNPVCGSSAPQEGSQTLWVTALGASQQPAGAWLLHAVQGTDEGDGSVVSDLEPWFVIPGWHLTRAGERRLPGTYLQPVWAAGLGCSGTPACPWTA